MRATPAGTVRITAGDHSAETILWPALAKLLPRYPDIKVELVIDYGLTDIVAERYDAGVRLGEQVAKDMIAVRIGPEMRMAVVGAPTYFAARSKPKQPQDLTEHNCINLRLPTYGGFYAWEFEKGGDAIKVRVEGQLAFPDPGGGAGRLRPGLSAGGCMQEEHRRRAARPNPRRLVSAVPRLSSLLPEPPSAHPSLYGHSGGASPPAVERQRFS